MADPVILDPAYVDLVRLAVGPHETLVRLVVALIPARATGAQAVVAEAVAISAEIDAAIAAQTPAPSPTPAPAPAPVPAPAPAPGALTWTSDTGTPHDWGDTPCQALASQPGVIAVQSCVVSPDGKRVDYTYTTASGSHTGFATR